ncbi:MAG TPA: hypothetical protein PLJ21_10720 [Pseudobdellovibrionaceae bacterium]|nr:hypothetical protein [Pseudobdellovibrionaceae bacterium]
MKTKKTTAFNALVAAALLGVLPAHAMDQSEGRDFVPYEQLQPEQRMILQEKVKALLEHFKIDFSSVKVGIDLDGNLILKGRTLEEIKLNPAGTPTCWTI